MSWRSEWPSAVVVLVPFVGHYVTSPPVIGPSGDRILAIALILALSAFVSMVVWLVAR